MKLALFRYNYFYITKTELRNNKTKCVELLGIDLYQESITLLQSEEYSLIDGCGVIVNIVKGCIVLAFPTSKKSILIDMKHSNFELFDTFRTDNIISYNQNIINMSSIEGKVINTYAVENIWFLIHYITSYNKDRILLNKNTFGRLSMLSSRDYKIHTILNLD